jgi:hypothetical protein
MLTEDATRRSLRPTKEVSMPEAAIRNAFAAQVDACNALGSPFTAALLQACLGALDRGTTVGRRLVDWPGDPSPRGDALALRLAGALHALAMSRRSPGLAALYPPAQPPSADALAQAVASAIVDHEAFILGFLDRAPQTNEVARSAVLYAGLIAVAGRNTAALEVLELGSSAGLNLMLDAYAYDFGGRKAGKAGSPLVLKPAWTGPVPAGPEPVIVERRGCDLSPIDVAQPEERLRLRAYIWADQSERLARQDAAVDIALRSPPPVDAMDAAPWVEERLARPAAPGVTRVLMHSIAFQYLPRDGQARVQGAMEEAGARATPDSPLAWLSFEQADGGPVLSLRTWPGDTTVRLARADPHVTRVTWE